MSLLLSYRRWWAIIVFAVLVAPFFGLFAPDLRAPVRTHLAPSGQWWLNASAGIDPFLNEQFGFRGLILQGNTLVRRNLKSQVSKLALVGEKGQMFFLSETNLEKALGLRVDRAALARYTELMDELNVRARQIGATFVVTSPPSGETVNFPLLPDWAKAQKVSPTNYDLLSEAMKARGITFVDLRQPVIAAEAGGRTYRLTDTHWNFRGSLIGLNEVLKAAGRPDLVLSEDDMLGEPVPERAGDLARLYGDESIKGDTNYPPVNGPTWKQDVTPIEGILQPSDTVGAFDAYAFSTGRPGPRVLIFGDSFSQYYWPPFLVDIASAFAWTHHNFCHADLSLIERFRPDIVIYSVTERHIGCTREAQD